jgi:hypothetical protein
MRATPHEVFLPETYVVRLEPLPAAIITTLEEIGIMTTPGPDGIDHRRRSALRLDRERS